VESAEGGGLGFEGLQLGGDLGEASVHRGDAGVVEFEGLGAVGVGGADALFADDVAESIGAVALLGKGGRSGGGAGGLAAGRLGEEGGAAGLDLSQARFAGGGLLLVCWPRTASTSPANGGRARRGGSSASRPPPGSSSGCRRWCASSSRWRPRRRR